MISLHYEKFEMKRNGKNFYQVLSFYQNCTVLFCFYPYKSLKSGQKIQTNTNRNKKNYWDSVIPSIGRKFKPMLGNFWGLKQNFADV